MNTNASNGSRETLQDSLLPDEKKLELFRKQKALLDTLLSTCAISQAQHDYSLNCLIEKMGIRNAAKAK